VEIESNYPRSNSFPIDKADIEALQKNAKWGLYFVNAQALFYTLSMVLAELPAIICILLFFVSGLGTLVFIIIWVTNAHYAVCSLRGIHSRIPSIFVGILSGIPYVLFFVPLSYTLDFLVIRSRSETERTMRWYSSFSRSLRVNLFAIALIAYTTLVGYSFLTIITNRPARYQGLMDWIAFTCFLYGLVVGVKIVWQVNHQIEVLNDSKTLTA
jgi:hypothetical protein